jgi:hypothetical protein
MFGLCLVIWEGLYNPSFKPLEFEGFKKEAGLNAFTLSPKKWIDTTNAIGLIAKSGRYGGTYAHKDITIERSIYFFYWLFKFARSVVVKSRSAFLYTQKKTVISFIAR